MNDTSAKEGRTDISPTPEKFWDLAARYPGPIVMLNLLKFKADAGDGRTGAAAYNAYGAAGTERVRARGGEVVGAGRPQAVLVGGAADHWDMVALVRYPSPRTLIEMGASPEYQVAARDREA